MCLPAHWDILICRKMQKNAMLMFYLDLSRVYIYVTIILTSKHLNYEEENYHH